MSAYSAEQIDAAVARLQEAERFAHASDLVTHAAPGLLRVLDAALDEGGWFGPAHRDQIARASALENPGERLEAILSLVSEQTRLGMLVGVAVGFELSRELARDASELIGGASPGEASSV